MNASQVLSRRFIGSGVGALVISITIGSAQANPLAAIPGVPGSGNDQLLTDPRVGAFVVDPSTIGLLSKEGTKVILWWEKYLYDIHEYYGRLTLVQDAYLLQGKPNSEIDQFRQAVNLCYQNSPRLGHTLDSGGAGGFYVLYVNRIRDHVGSGNYKWCAGWLKNLRENLPKWEADVKQFTAQRTSEGVRGAVSGEKPRSAAWDPFSVFLANKELLVGQLMTLNEIPTCELKGWGRDCQTKVGKAVTLKRIGPSFEQFEQAKKYFCENMIIDSTKGSESPRTVALTGGRDHEARFRFSDTPGGYLAVQNAPGCS
jgi:hypothetical protein